MKFFDPKEEVIDIQLTQEGKRQLAQGRFQPAYYAFFDDDILYDVEYASYSEEQNKSVNRIRDNTPRLKVQYNRNGVESSFKKLREQRLFGRDISTEAMDRNDTVLPLGTSTGNKYAPAWKIRLANGEFVGPTQYYSASWGYARIPQMSASVEVATEVQFDELNGSNGSLGVASGGSAGRPLTAPDQTKTGVSIEQLERSVYSDGSYLVTSQPSIVIDIAELNNQFGNENFDIEVFEVIEESFGTLDKKREILRPLWFGQPNEVDYSTHAIDESPPEIDKNYAEHYIDVFVDGELDQSAMDVLFGTKSPQIMPEQTPYGVSNVDFDDDELKEPC